MNTRDVISRFPSCTILVVGDFMLDHFVWGRVDRISPEAPVPVVDVERETFHPGGAGNVVMNLRSLGARVLALGVTGEDSAGMQIRSLLHQQGVSAEGLLLSSRSTTVKTRIIAHQQQVVRVDREERHFLPDDVQTALSKAFFSVLGSVDAVLLSDYSKGCLAPNLLAAILPEAKRLKKPVFVDPKPRLFLQYSPVTVITPNQAEAASVLGYPIVTEEDLREAGRRILDKIECEALLLTRGEKGMVLFTKKEMTVVPAHTREVYDVTGAGDTVVSTLCLASVAGAEILQAVNLANTAAGIVVGKVGTATLTPEELLALS